MGAHSQLAFTFDADGPAVCNACNQAAVHYSLTPCNHFICSVCSLRRRIFQKDNTCATCGKDVPTTIVTDTTANSYADYSNTELYADVVYSYFHSLNGYGIRCATQAIFEDAVSFLDSQCDVCYGREDL